ncbi:16S rRNA (guanine(527)-N(7))-methyltransferase RsmG [Seleniivibrio sp.]|uniref:16S rRNA (guanine(527)-N(7))-methyltransferase RsmG n=1 Tax=Seleniivibrio sp. TaxID=2898801 RepID=UPI0025D5305F|nr:16S rRNA (guanine(527)-N(7))-methyltransferase RsmG [Seleniivibrio sp.]MCD8553887.1 16S rRNA (guanine(527)-N(7))-methyltransferase RsmG [Seleniivibrio sp.]
MIEQYFPFSESQLKKIEQFYEIHVNAVLNVTAIKDKEDFYRKHVLDSFLLFTERKNILKSPVCDIGTGGGFPGIILAIMYPHIKFTLVDSIAKKCKFVEDAAKELGLDNVEVITSRAENIKNRKFATILSRGVAKTAELLKFTENLADKRSVWVLYKGENAEAELFASKITIVKKHLEWQNVRYDEPIQRTYTIIHHADDDSRLH